ncbi:MAG: IS630 family transposase [Anaerolineae bacterium]|nr:IS630 family transposase [Anaerolineae bacterium]
MIGALTEAYFPKANRLTFIEFLEQILQTYPTGTILLILDNARYHTARDVMKWLEQHPCLTILWLPKYAAELNPIEKLWWYLKNKVSANRCYPTIEDLLKAGKAFLAQMDREEILQLTSLLPKKTFA